MAQKPRCLSRANRNRVLPDELILSRRANCARLCNFGLINIQVNEQSAQRQFSSRGFSFHWQDHLLEDTRGWGGGGGQGVQPLAARLGGCPKRGKKASIQQQDIFGQKPGGESQEPIFWSGPLVANFHPLTRKSRLKKDPPTRGPSGQLEKGPG